MSEGACTVKQNSFIGSMAAGCEEYSAGENKPFKKQFVIIPRVSRQVEVSAYTSHEQE